MSIPLVDPNAPSQEELVEQQVAAMKAQLAHRLAIEAVGRVSGVSSQELAEYCIDLSNKLVEAYRPKTLTRMVN